MREDICDVKRHAEIEPIIEALVDEAVIPFFATAHFLFGFGLIDSFSQFFLIYLPGRSLRCRQHCSYGGLGDNVCIFFFFFFNHLLIPWLLMLVAESL